MTAAWEAKLRTEAREAVETITQLRVSVGEASSHQLRQELKLMDFIGPGELICNY